MYLQLKKLKAVRSQSCVTILLNTHRTSPDNQKDPIALKNLVKEAEERLLETEDKRQARNLIERLNNLASGINHTYNLESLALFVNEDVAEFIRLPISVRDRVIIDETFATRDLIRAIHLETNYYILVLSRQKARLIEAFNDKVVREISENFPMENDQETTDREDLSISSKITRRQAEFFNQVDKEVHRIWKEDPLPVMIGTDQANYPEYLKVADNKKIYLDYNLNSIRENESAQAIVANAWNILEDKVRKRNQARLAELKQAVSQNKFLSDVNEIWRSIKEGRVQTLFVQKGLFQPAVIEDGFVRFVGEEELHRKEVIDDIYDELIEENLEFGGDVVFLPEGELDTFNGFGAVTRY